MEKEKPFPEKPIFQHLTRNTDELGTEEFGLFSARYVDVSFPRVVPGHHRLHENSAVFGAIPVGLLVPPDEERDVPPVRPDPLPFRLLVCKS